MPERTRRDIVRDITARHEQPDGYVRAMYARWWTEFVEKVSFRTGKVTLINWAGGDPHFRFEIMVYDSYEDTWRPLHVIEGFSAYMIEFHKPEDPHRCPVVREFHRTFRKLFAHEVDEYFKFDGKRIFDPHNEETRLPGVLY